MRFGIVSFLSDFGLADPFVGICHGVIAGIAPQAHIIDLTHQVPRQDVIRGALALADSVGWLPPAVHLAVVDPGVGTPRRPVAVAAGQGLLVGPDNGLLTPAAERLGGIDGVWELTDERYRLPTVSATFHGRDVFAPAAAHLAAGIAPADLGAAVDPATLSRLALPEPQVSGRKVTGQVEQVDAFGNLGLNVRPDHLAGIGVGLGDVVSVTVGAESLQARSCQAYGELEPGEAGVLEDSFGRIAVVVNRGSAADVLGVGVGSNISLTCVTRPRNGQDLP